MRRVLVLEANEALKRDLLLGLHERGVDAEAVSSADEARATLHRGHVDVAILGPGGGSARELLEAIIASPSATHAEVIAALDGPAGLQAMRSGAADFVPLSSGIDALVSALSKLEARRAFRARGDYSTRTPPAGREEAAGAEARTPAPGAAAPRAASRPPSAASGLVGQSAKVVAVHRMIERIAAVKVAVLIGGESGTGKELVARALHDQSPWRDGPFVAVNCGALPPGLIESELFGHVRGSFTDAVRDKRGLFEVADGGTLFLDEIADLPLALQPRLLRVVQDGLVRPVGGVDDVRVEVRLVAATARTLPSEVEAGRFREDLYYRLAGLSVELPPLRDRRDDIPLLARHFLVRACARSSLSVGDIDPAALRLLCAYRWPGNVRELENTIERAAVLCSGAVIDAASLPERIVLAGTGSAAPPARSADGGTAAGDLAPDPLELSIKRTSRRTEELLIKRALAETGGNRTRAAELLEISHRALLYKIKEYGIVVPRD